MQCHLLIAEEKELEFFQAFMVFHTIKVIICSVCRVNLQGNPEGNVFLTVDVPSRNQTLCDKVAELFQSLETVTMCCYK